MVLLAAPWTGQAQLPDSKGLSFEVATIDPSRPSPNSNLNFKDDGFTARNFTLQGILVFAYHLTSPTQLVGAPAWVNSARFDITAKEMPDVADKMNHMSGDGRMDAYRSMIQGLLADRFGLRMHFEKREMPVLALTIARSGSKLQPANSTEQGPELHNPGPGQMEGKDIDLQMLTSQLSLKPEIGGRMVIDKTGLTGKYDFQMTWTSGNGSNSSAAGPSLFTALQEQLGLRLNSIKAPVDVVVIDRVEMPSPN
jgi:uncharacterized protein (TIGR03435 family)